MGMYGLTYSHCPPRGNIAKWVEGKLIGYNTDHLTPRRGATFLPKVLRNWPDFHYRPKKIAILVQRLLQVYNIFFNEYDICHGLKLM